MASARDCPCIGLMIWNLFGRRIWTLSTAILLMMAMVRERVMTVTDDLWINQKHWRGRVWYDVQAFIHRRLSHPFAALMSTENSSTKWCLQMSFAAATLLCWSTHAQPVRTSICTWTKLKPGDFWVNPSVNFIKRIKTWTIISGM